MYVINSEPRMIVTRKGNKLFGEGQSGNRPWFAKSETEFFLKQGNAWTTFVKDTAGNVTGLILHGAGQHIPTRKIDMSIKEAQKKCCS